MVKEKDDKVYLVETTESDSTKESLLSKERVQGMAYKISLVWFNFHFIGRKKVFSLFLDQKNLIVFHFPFFYVLFEETIRLFLR